MIGLKDTYCQTALLPWCRDDNYLWRHVVGVVEDELLVWRAAEEQDVDRLVVRAE